MGKRKVLSEEELKVLNLPGEGQLFARVVKLMGGDNILVKCTDGKTRLGRIRGKLKRRIWIRENDVVIVAPWDFSSDRRCDVIWRYTLAQVDWLKNNNYTPEDL